jgi:transforming growth factor-beta-induced protein
MRKDFKNGVIKSVNNDNIRVGVLPTGILLINNSANITKSYKATNGIIHIIDEVLIPPKNLVDTILSESRFSTLAKAVKAAGLVSALTSSSKEYTIFAPTNTAFQALGTNAVNALLKDPATLKSILLYHTISGSNLKSDLKSLGSSGSVKTYQGSKLQFRFTNDVLSINNATVVEANILASNGVIHEINKVLKIPK